MGQVNNWFEKYSASQGINHYAIHSLLYLRTIQEKYIKMYERFVNQLKEYSSAIRIIISPKNIERTSRKI